MKEFIIAKEVRLGTYKSNILPPSAQIAYQMHLADINYLPRCKERIPYLVILNDNHSNKLKDSVISVKDFFKKQKILLNNKYYIEKLILPAIDRILLPINVDVFEWYRNFSKNISASSENIYYHNMNNVFLNDVNPMKIGNANAIANEINSYFDKKNQKNNSDDKDNIGGIDNLHRSEASIYQEGYLERVNCNVNIQQKKIDDFFKNLKFKKGLNDIKKNSFFRNSKKNFIGENTVSVNNDINTNLNQAMNDLNNNFPIIKTKRQIQLKFEYSRKETENLEESEYNDNILYNDNSFLNKLKEYNKETDVLKYNLFLKNELNLNYENSYNLLLSDNNYSRTTVEEMLLQRKALLLEGVKSNILKWKRNELEKICRFCSNFDKIHIRTIVPCSNYNCKIFYEKKLFD